MNLDNLSRPLIEKNKIFEMTPIYCDEIIEALEDGKIYISEKYSVAIHLCACGCKQKTVTPLGVEDWKLTKIGNKVTLRPSIGNFMGEKPYHAHY